MNFKSLGHFTALILLIEAVLMLPALILSLVFHEPLSTQAYLETLLIILVLGGILWLLSRGEKADDFYEKRRGPFRAVPVLCVVSQSVSSL